MLFDGIHDAKFEVCSITIYSSSKIVLEKATHHAREGLDEPRRPALQDSNGLRSDRILRKLRIRRCRARGIKSKVFQKQQQKPLPPQRVI